MTFRPSSLAFAALALLASTAHADPADLDVPGPGDRSFVYTAVTYDKSRFDSVVKATGESYGRSTSTTRGLEIQGRIALHERINVDLTAGRSLTRFESNLTIGSFATQAEQNRYGVGVTARPIGSATDPGFGLVFSLEAVHPEGDDTTAYVSAQPQFRFSPTLLGAVEVGLYRGRDDDRGQMVRTQLVWKASPNLSVIPSLAWTRIEPGADLPDTHALSAALGMAYHIDDRLALLTAYRITRNRDQDTGTLRAVDFRTYGVEVGLRYAF